MSIKTILVPLDGSETSRNALDAAFIIGHDLSAHVEALHVATDPKDAVPLLGEGMSAAIIEEMIQLAEAESIERKGRAEALFEDARTRYGLEIKESPPSDAGGSTVLTHMVGREDEITALKGRLSDLIVASRPSMDSEATLAMTINAALFETGRPVLVVPPKTQEVIGRKIAVSWNGSAEAARAVAAAMPLLARADSVVILTAENDSTSANLPLQLETYFSWHGIKADIRNLPGGSQVGEVLLEDCRTIGTDLLVMGAYTHSRMRQLILGGVTKHIMSEADLPVLMAH